MSQPLAAGAVLLAAALACQAAPDWPDTPSSRAFRQRVVELAVLYDTSSGLDENGFLIETTLLPGADGPCKLVEARISRGGEPVRQDILRACPRPAH